MCTSVHVIMHFIIFFHFCYNYFKVTFIFISIIFSYMHKRKWSLVFKQLFSSMCSLTLFFSLSYQNKLSMSFVLIIDRCADDIFQVNFISTSCAIILISHCYPFGFLGTKKTSANLSCNQSTASLPLLPCNLTYRNQCRELQF